MDRWRIAGAEAAGEIDDRHSALALDEVRHALLPLFGVQGAMVIPFAPPPIEGMGAFGGAGTGALAEVTDQADVLASPLKMARVAAARRRTTSSKVAASVLTRALPRGPAA
mgnify:CR=1 FL=1